MCFPQHCCYDHMHHLYKQTDSQYNQSMKSSGNLVHSSQEVRKIAHELEWPYAVFFPDRITSFLGLWICFPVDGLSTVLIICMWICIALIVLSSRMSSLPSPNVKTTGKPIQNLDIIGYLEIAARTCPGKRTYDHPT